jgi:hypothetical protein
MKRDINLMRQLLLDIENRGADCSVSVLHTGPDQQREERNRYHLRLLIDARLLKEIDRTADDIPCVRLTHQGHELLELIRDESIWQEALWTCQDRTGNQSLTMIQELLGSWASRRARQPIFGRHRPSSISGHRLEPSRRPYREARPYREDQRAWEELRYQEEQRYREELGYPIRLAYPDEPYQPSVYRERAPRDYPEARYAPVRETSYQSYSYDQPWRSISRERAGRFDLNGENRFHTTEDRAAEPPYDSTLADHIL